MKKLLLIIFTFHFSLFTCIAQGTWSPRPPLPAAARAGSVGFSIGDYGYMGLGYKSIYLKDFWQFDPSSSDWTQKTNFPGSARVCPATFVIGKCAYIVTGQDTNSNDVTECWQYNSITDTWLQKASFPGTARAYDVGFAIDGKGYVGTGYANGGLLYSDFWVYDTARNSWDSIGLFGGGARFGASAFSVKDSGYVCFGEGTSGKKEDIWEYDTLIKRWTQKSNYPGFPIYASTGFVIRTDIYVGTGQDTTSYYNNNFWRYNTLFGEWSKEERLPGFSRVDCAAFGIGDSGYVGLGFDSVLQYYSSIFRFAPDSSAGIDEVTSNTQIQIYPNPFITLFTVLLPLDAEGNMPFFILTDIEGRKIDLQIKNNHDQYIIDGSNLIAGIYILTIKYNNRVYYKKLVKTY